MTTMRTQQQEELSTSVPGTEAAGIARFGLWLLVLGFGGFLLWAGLAPLDQGVVGNVYSHRLNLTEGRGMTTVSDGDRAAMRAQLPALKARLEGFQARR